MRRAGLVMLLAAFAIPGGTAPAPAQTVPEGQSCGGLLCDLGVFGHKTEPSAAPATQPAGVQPAKAAEAKPPAEAKPVPRKPKRVAKAPEKLPAASPDKVRATARAETPERAAAAPAPTAQPARATAIAAQPAAPEIFVPMTPYSSPQPSPVTLTPITPN